MGKRKRNTDNASLPSSSDNMPCSSGKKLLFKEVGKEPRAFPQGFDVADNSGHRLNMPSSFTHQHQNLACSFVLKRHRHPYGHQSSRRNSGNHASASTARGKFSFSREDRIPIKFTTQSGPESGRFTGNNEGTFSGPERTNFSSFKVETFSFNSVKMICGICQRRLRRELTVAGVLACGHVYHTECLEARTRSIDKHDPPCPLCTGLILEAKDNQENKPQTPLHQAQAGAEKE